MLAAPRDMRPCSCATLATRLRCPATVLTVAAVALAAIALQPRHVAGERHIAAAAQHVCVVMDGGGVACRGNATTTGRLVPPAGLTFHAVTAGDTFSCGLTTNGSSLRCWGALPGGTAQLPVSTFFIDAHAGPRHVCGLVPNGTVYCYGDASSRGAINVPPGVAFQGVTAGTNYTCGVARNHSVVCWGDATNPVVAAASTWRAIADAEHVAAGADHACYVRINGSVACWGSNTRGAAAPPAALVSSGNVWWLAAGAGMTCAMSGSSVPGPVTCWGAVTEIIAAAGYEVACSSWGCVASTPRDSTSSGDSRTGSGRVVVVAAAGGPPRPQGLADDDGALVTTLAGSGVAGSMDGVGTMAQFFYPRGVTLDGIGGLYVADLYNQVIRRVDIASRAVTTVAGVVGTAGRVEGATPLQSTFYYPSGVEVGDAGNVYVADSANNAIRMLSGAWVAGSTTGVSGSANAATGTNATFNNPYAVRADVGGGVLYVTDYYNYQIRTVATTGSRAVATLATFQTYVWDIALVVEARIMYVSVGFSVFIVTYDGTSTLLVGNASASGYADGIGAAARFDTIRGLTLDAAAGVLYATDFNHYIRRITTADRVVTTLAGSGMPALVDGFGTAASFYRPRGIALNAASGTLYVGDQYNHAIRQVQLPLPAPAVLAAAPLPPSPLAAAHQLAAWRALGTANSSNSDASPLLDARNATFSSPPAATNTAGFNPAIRALWLRNVTLVPRNPAPAASGNTNTTFSTSAQRGLRSLALSTLTVPPAALALPALTNLTLAAPLPTQALQLTAGSMNGLATLTCVNCGAVAGLANLSGIILGSLLTQPPYLPLVTALDASATGITAVYEHDFDGLPALCWLSVATNSLTYFSDAACTAATQPVLEAIDQSNNPLVTGSGCPPTTYLRGFNLLFNGATYSACSACPAGAFCAGGGGLPVPCGANTYAAGGAAACVPCPPGTYAIKAAEECITCPPGLAAPGCNATASWRDNITVVADFIGGFTNTSIDLVPTGAQSGAANLTCSPVVVVSTATMSCALPFLLPAAATAPILTYVWVTHAGGIPRRHNATVLLVPPPPVVVAPGGSTGLVPLTPGGGRIVLRLPAARLTTSDWTAAGLQPPSQATIDMLTAVWLGGAPCTNPSWESSTTLSCSIPALDGVDIPAVVQLARLFNVSSVLPSVFTPPALAAEATDLALLPPAGAAAVNSTINITLPGVALCVGQRPRLSAAFVGGLRCASLRCDAGRTDAAVCVGWNATAAAAAGLLQYAGPTNVLNATAVWANRATPLVACDACVALATRPVLASITPASIAAAGVPVVVAGTGMVAASRAPPSVYVGTVLCDNLQVLDTRFVRCNAPAVLPSASGYPVVSVVVVNAAGVASTEPVTLTYPAEFAVSWATTPATAALPGGLLSPAPTLLVSSREAATCSLAINVSSCATSNPALASRPAGMSVSTPTASLAVVASGNSSAVLSALLLSALTVGGASGCTGVLTASCIDAVGLTASTTGHANPTVALASWRADWNASGMPAFVVPAALPELSAVFSLVGNDGVLTASSATSLSCLALLASESVAPPPLTQSLDRVSSRDMLSSVTGTVTLVNGTAAGVAFADLTAAAARLGQALALYAECTWVPTGERLRLPTLSLAVANVSLALTPAMSMLVEAYESADIAAIATLSPSGVASMASAGAACTWRAGAATTPSIVLAASTVASSWTLDASGAIVGAQPLTLTVEGPPGATLTLQLVCSLWSGNTVASPPLNITTAEYAVELRGGTSRAVWPSGTSVVLPLAPALDVAAPSRGVLTCSAEVASVMLPPPTYAPGVGLGLADTSVQLIGEPSVSVSLASAATRANVSLPRVGLRTPGGTNASLAVTCRDGVGRSAVLGAAIDVSVAALRASWRAGTAASIPAIVVPTQQLPFLTLTLASTPAVPLPPGADVRSLVTCMAALVRASAALPLNVSLSTLLAAAPPYESVTAAPTNVVLGADNASVVVTLPQLSLATCPLSTPLVVAAECTWAPTGERVRLPTLTTTTLPLFASWVAPPTNVLGYSAVPLHMVATLAAPASNPTGATAASARCEVVLLNATMRGVSVAADAWAMEVNAGAYAGTSVPTSVNVTLQAPPGTRVFVQVNCDVWGQVLATPPLRLTAATVTLQLLSGLPDFFIASDASSPWPLTPQLSLRFVTNDGAAVTDVSCAVATSTPGAEFKVIGSSASLQSVAAHATTGSVFVPPFVVQTSPTMEAVAVTVECRRSSGDVLPPLAFTVPAINLHAEVCDTPQITTEVGTALPPFDVGIVAVAANGSVHNPCAATPLPPTTALPSIVCSISLNTSATTTNDTASIFLQHTLTTVAGATHRATFDAFTLVAPQGQTYGLTLTCAVGGMAIPPSLSFTVGLVGCRPGQESVSVACVTCGGGMFSLGGMGARCTGCPPVGATCNEGILTLLPNYFRPESKAGTPLGPDTELHPCYNSEACTLEYSSNNASSLRYGCSPGYTGPLCGVCDADINYARFGEACALCWDAGASWTFLTAVMLVVLAVLTRVALRKDGSRSDASIVLRITLGYLQAVGSLRVFRAGSTKAYDSVMGWTEVVSASPLSAGALQCILWMPYLLQYVMTVALPLLASVAVVVIFHAVTTGRSVHCTPRFRLDTVAFKAAVSAWWASKRHLSTLLFVLFLAYMPIVSASLRALDCIDPVAGTQYLRSDLRVECGEGQHAVARALAYGVLVALGIGFPAGLAWLLGTARNDQLADSSFHATWGFLFDGYRAPLRTLVPSAGSGGDKRISRKTLVSRRPLMGSGAAKSAVAGIADSKLMAPPGMNGARSGPRRSSIMPERLMQAWVVAGDSRVWWETVVLGRKAGVVLLAVTVTNPYMQCAGASLWFLGALLLQVRYAPYVKPLFNALETASLVSTLLTAIASTALLQFNVGVSTADLHPPESMDGIEWAVTVLLSVLNVGTFAVLAGLWLRLQCARAKRVVRFASLVSALTARGRGAGTTARSIDSAGDAVAAVAAAGRDDAVPASTVNPLRARAGVTGIVPAVASPPSPPDEVADGAVVSTGALPIAHRRGKSFAATPVGYGGRRH